MEINELHIVLADDDFDDRLIFKDAFKQVKVKHTLELYKDGYTLMNYLEVTKNLPHIIFLDLNMPGKSGRACIKEIRGNNRYRAITIAIYSTSKSPKDIEDTFIAGANIYITKPDDFLVLKKIIDQVIGVTRLYVTDGLNRENFIISF